MGPPLAQVSTHVHSQLSTFTGKLELCAVAILPLVHKRPETLQGTLNPSHCGLGSGSLKGAEALTDKVFGRREQLLDRSTPPTTLHPEDYARAFAQVPTGT